MIKAQHNSNGRTLLGTGLIILGTLFLLQNIFVEFFIIDLFSWPVILFTVGLLILFNHRDSFFGILMITVGGIGIASKILHIPFKYVISDHWPIILIVIGIYIIAQSFFKSKSEDSIIEGDNLYFDLFKVFGDENKLVRSSSLRGGKLTTIMGELNVDLIESTPALPQIIIDNLTLFGSTSLRIPQNWDVIIKTTTIFGGLEDKRTVVETSEENKNVLVIKGIILFGGGSISN